MLTIMLRVSVIINVDNHTERVPSVLALPSLRFRQSIGLMSVSFPNLSFSLSTTGPVSHELETVTRGEVLSRSDWLMDTRSYSDWLVFYEVGKISHPSTMPPRDEREFSIDRK